MVNSAPRIVLYIFAAGEKKKTHRKYSIVVEEELRAAGADSTASRAAG